MAHIGGEVYTTIKEAIKYSSGDYGLISHFEDAEGKFI
jgi:hypothetical protein